MKLKLLLLLILLVGCRSKKVTVDKDLTKEISTSEITSGLIQIEYRDRLVYLTRPVSGNSVIEDPCKDGVLATINTEITSGGNTSRIYSMDGKLFLEQFIDSTSSSLEKRYLVQYKQDSITNYNAIYKELSHSEKIKVFVWPWWVYGLIIGIILFAGLWVYTKFIL